MAAEGGGMAAEEQLAATRVLPPAQLASALRRYWATLLPTSAPAATAGATTGPVTWPVTGGGGGGGGVPPQGGSSPEARDWDAAR